MHPLRSATRFLTLGSLGLAAMALLWAPAAGARGHGHAPKRTFDRTFPVATKLCAKADAGTLGDQLQASRAQVQAACTTLHGSFDAAVATYTAATTPLTGQAATIIATARAACHPATTTTTTTTDDSGHGTGSDAARRGSGPSAECRAARATARTQLRALRTQWRSATRTYRGSVHTARRTFWGTIRGLAGGATQPTDADGTNLPSSPSIPTDDAASHA